MVSNGRTFQENTISHKDLADRYQEIFQKIAGKVDGKSPMVSDGRTCQKNKIFEEVLAIRNQLPDIFHKIVAGKSAMDDYMHYENLVKALKEIEGIDSAKVELVSYKDSSRNPYKLFHENVPENFSGSSCGLSLGSRPEPPKSKSERKKGCWTEAEHR
ncbi:hypothetical protein AMTR_s00040p00123110 [Amborella trichopoda]|uniref:Uncharacterized protein n=1 Tax=Amborella trichopoda TaxID=13333 RepID=W1PYK1_AMBTC|nr:hypothetical protein AMTR_s00040p00123110 [Amborella trichopoda]